MMKRNILYIFVCIPLIMLLASCSTTRKISDRDQLFIGLEKIKYGIIDSVRSLTDMLSAYNEKYGDYLCGNPDNELYIDDIEWVY